MEGQVSCPVNAAIPPSKAKRALGLLREVQTLILAEPKRVDMSIVYVEKPKFGDSPRFTGGRDFPACGAVGCVAGWVHAMKGDKNLYVGDRMAWAGRLLGLNARQQRTLFMPRHLMYHNDGQTPEYAQRVSRHIDRFIRKNLRTLRYKKV